MKRTTLQKNLVVKEELDGINDIDDIVNLQDLLEIVIIHEECGILKVFVDGGELSSNKKEKVTFLQLNIQLKIFNIFKIREISITNQ